VPPVRRRHGDIFRYVPETAEKGLAGNIWDNIKGVSWGAWDLAKRTIAGIEHAQYGQMGGAGGQYAGRYQFGANEIAETAKGLGEPVPTRGEFLRDRAMQERFMSAYTLGHHRWLMENSEKYRGLSGREQLAVLGYAHNQGAEGAAKWLETGQAGRDAFGTSGAAYSEAIGRALKSLAPAAGGGPARPADLPDVNVTAPAGPRMPTAAEPLGGGGAGPQSMNLDSSHKVEVHFVNAPTGMRSGLTKAEGPAEVSVRTHYSMDSLS
jgi:hypothetical protein